MAFGHGMGYVASCIPGERHRVVKTNLRLCFPEFDSAKIDRLSKQHWRLLGRSIAEKSIIWHGSVKQLSKMIEVKSAVDLSSRKPRILVNMHFTGIEGSIILSALAKEKNWPRTSGFFQRMKNPFFNQKIIVFDDQEIVTALDTGSTRNYTLTAPKVSSYITNADPIVDLTTGKTMWVTYVLSGGTVSGDLPCSNFMKVTGTTNPENVNVKFNSGGFKHLNSGYTATQIHILHQFTDNGDQPIPNQWYIKNYTNDLSSINDLKTGFTFTLNETKINDAESNGYYVSSLTNFGKQRTYTEGTVSTVIGTDIQVMNFVINLPDSKFTISQNPTYVSGTKYITEIALLNSNKETMVVGKFSAPRARTTSVDVFSVKLDF